MAIKIQGLIKEMLETENTEICIIKADNQIKKIIIADKVEDILHIKLFYVYGRDSQAGVQTPQRVTRQRGGSQDTFQNADKSYNKC